MTDKCNPVIPRFYKPPPTDDDPLQTKLLEEARTKFLQKKSKDLVSNSEFELFWDELQRFHTHPHTSEGEEMIGYLDFMRVKDRVPQSCRKFVTAVNFAKFHCSDPSGRIPILDLFNYVMRKMWLEQTRIGLSLYDCFGLGYHRETDLDNYIYELIPTLPQLDKLESSFHSFYVCTATRKFFFFLDPLRSGKIKIRDILACGFLEDLLQLRNDTDQSASDCKDADGSGNSGGGSGGGSGGSGGSGSGGGSGGGGSGGGSGGSGGGSGGGGGSGSGGSGGGGVDNWFSAQSTMRVYGVYLSLDADHNGMLSRSELGQYNTGSLTPAFIERVFEECMSYEGEIDYKSYLDFVLALENRKEPQSLHYFFRLLDFDHKSYLTVFNLHFFYKSLKQKIESQGGEAIPFSDIQDEIFDMVKPRDPHRITLHDLISCGMGDTVVSILIDVNSFWAYENREVVLSEAASTEKT